MKLQRHLQALAFAVLAAAPAFAADVTVGGRTEVWYDDNVIGSERGKVADGEVLISPKIGVSERWGSVDTSLEFNPTYELFFQEADLRGWDYQTNGSLQWQPSPRTKFSLTDSFYRNRNLRLLTLAGPVGGTPAESGSRDKFFRNVAAFSVDHALSPIDSLAFSAGYSFWRFNEAARPDQDGYFASTRYEHSLTRTVGLGAQASWSRQAAKAVGNNPRRDTDYFNASLVATYEPRDTFLVRASAGPTYVRQPKFRVPNLLRLDLYRFSGNRILVGLVPSTCPTLPTGEFYDGLGCNLAAIGPTLQPLFAQLVSRALEPTPFAGALPDRDDLTYFADLSLSRRWNAGSLELGYNRDQGSNSSVGFSSIVDTVSLRGSYQPTRSFSLNAVVFWEDRKETQSGDRFVTVLGTLAASGTAPAINFLVPIGVRAVDLASAAETVESLDYVRRRTLRAERACVARLLDSMAPPGREQQRDVQRLRTLSGDARRLHRARTLSLVIQE